MRLFKDIVISKEFIIKQARQQQEQVCFFVLCAIAGIVVILLVQEYIYFKNQAQKLIMLQDQYRVYTESLKKILEEQSDEENSKSGCCSLSCVIPEGARIFSTHTTIDEFSDSLISLNRNPDHLKKTTLDYLKAQQLENLISQVNWDDWHHSEKLSMIANPKSTKPAPQRISQLSRPQKQQHWRTNKKSYDSACRGIFVWPIEQKRFWLSSLFGPRKKPNGSWGFHYGIDMAALRGTPVTVAAAGFVQEARYVPGYGNTVVVVHNAVYKTRYAHLDSLAVKERQRISAGTIVGTVGDTGFTRKSGKDASHLHFEVYERGKHVNPLYFLMSQ